ncbi:LysM peptidoglycan-binding domain-containing protein [Pararhizobium haloflavum]|uniref:LysM peptidoglycan-binding domain-containing protein n=1 Tax=Pararhizobium haloflavum TaxID=2037914 RepID=UPI0012FFD5BE|nr:LysM peptidoglycan-binding domain-containing protein [Pararhizobium haloflavum]
MPHGTQRRIFPSLTIAGGAIVASLLLASGVEPAGAQCTSRLQTGVGSSAVALAQRCGTTVGDLRRANPGRDLDRPGLLNIPGGRTSAVPNTLNNEIAPRPPRIRATRQKPIVSQGGRPAPTMRQETGGALYRIQRGDTLGAIARSRGLALQSLLQANPGVVPNRLSVGQTIRVPAS